METIQIVLDSELKQATDRAAKQNNVNRSALIREAIREHLKKLKIREMEEQDRRAYELVPENVEETLEWTKEGVWPEEE